MGRWQSTDEHPRFREIIVGLIGPVRTHCGTQANKELEH